MADIYILVPLSKVTNVLEYSSTPGFNHIGKDSHIFFNLDNILIADFSLLDTIPIFLSLLNIAYHKA